MKSLRLLGMAREWAKELGKFKGYEDIVAQEANAGFVEVEERGRNPDVVLKEVLARITERIECQSSAPISAKNASIASN